MRGLAAGLTQTENIEPGVRVWQCREVTIEVDPPQPVTVDGETGGETPITAKLHPQALHVLVPAANDEDDTNTPQENEDNTDE